MTKTKPSTQTKKAQRSSKQNRSHAVMGRRHEAVDSPDYFPTPPWATRALLEEVLGGKAVLSKMTCLEPACGPGHMVKALSEYFEQVTFADAYDYGYGPIRNFLDEPNEKENYDWIITNPPFRLLKQFTLRALEMKPRKGVAMLARTTILEGIDRYNRLYSVYPPTIVAPFVERVTMLKDRFDPKVCAATAYSWLIWEMEPTSHTRVHWLPPMKKGLERADSDYSLPISRLPLF